MRYSGKTFKCDCRQFQLKSIKYNSYYMYKDHDMFQTYLIGNANDSPF